MLVKLKHLTHTSTIGRLSLIISSCGAVVAVMLIVAYSFVFPDNPKLLGWALGYAIICSLIGLALGLVAGIRSVGRMGVMLSVSILTLSMLLSLYLTPTRTNVSDPITSTDVQEFTADP